MVALVWRAVSAARKRRCLELRPLCDSTDGGAATLIFRFRIWNNRNLTAGQHTLATLALFHQQQSGVRDCRSTAASKTATGSPLLPRTSFLGRLWRDRSSEPVNWCGGACFGKIRAARSEEFSSTCLARRWLLPVRPANPSHGSPVARRRRGSSRGSGSVRCGEAASGP